MHLRHNVRSKVTFLVSQIALLLFFLLHLPARLHPQFHPDLMDGLRGFFLGIAIGTMILTAWKHRRRTV
jgi:hypothetical protein